ncbi:Putative amidotransferase similar to cobyric acid synthase [Candidatus Syntrophocurvum alkaliphilum]|uniref:Lipid II isoglutaminyl synthase (glutamine-hydrolyzing) subunit GatD n=1 Tax=Candidatus Syntrophocurvum alkaliphilum TaxID=2293317 RepID=A0A6I6DH42_9FIRM|nr:glutamine amidotransferase [Candidatus Syntrophocurvum alkaliphilum]QGT99680.1 Putative amidotransferase similar to cobyric acid synthase [Candidatus Syntrophocurvum alkaliphilum]
MVELTIAHLYPDLMNLYGDRGNIISLKKRIEWYGFKCNIKNIYLSDDVDLANIDMIFMGSGSNREQNLVYLELIKKADNLLKEIDRGLPALFICGAYQLLGNSYKNLDGTEVNGLKFFNIYTLEQKKRLTGDILIESKINNEIVAVVGFENHAGKTFFEDDKLLPFGTVIKGYGNNGEDNKEGLLYNNLIGTNLHGPLLPKNPKITDYFIKNMLQNKGVELTNNLLNDELEIYANEQTKKKILAK